MKYQKYADRYKGRHGTFKTSGGGNFEGYIGNYDPESNTVDVWNGFERTRVDADKIVSAKAKPIIGPIIFIIFWIIGMFIFLDIIKTPDYTSRIYNYDQYERY